ncbi:MAG: flippase-like domain-containing protein [Candidatus Omnitrophica bacterium]|nr:flippase-like domain-containing protein [Candidatus Omnitrophota bacterium]
MKGKLGAFLRIFVSAGLMALLLWLMRDEFGDIVGTISSGNQLMIAGAMLVFALTAVLLSIRQKIIFMGEDLTLPLGKSVQLTFLGYFFNNFMPTAVGGDIIKAHYASKLCRHKLKSYASVLMDRFLGLYTFLIIAGAALAVDRGKIGLQAVRPTVFALLLVGIAGFVVVTNRRVYLTLEKAIGRLKMFGLGDKLNSIYGIVHDYRNRYGIVGKSITVSIISQSVYFLVVYMFFRSLGSDMGLGNVFLVMPVVTFVSMIPSVGGLGVREGAIVALFSPLAGKETAFAVSLLLLCGLLFLSLIGGLIYLWWGFTGHIDKDEM